MNASTITLAICLSAAIAAPASAQSARHSDATTDAPQMTVRYGDLDLTKTQGAVVLIQRIKNAAVAACGAEPSVLSLAAGQRFNACVHKNMDVAVAAVNAPQITAFYQGRSPATRMASK